MESSEFWLGGLQLGGALPEWGSWEEPIWQVLALKVYGLGESREREATSDPAAWNTRGWAWP